MNTSESHTGRGTTRFLSNSRRCADHTNLIGLGKYKENNERKRLVGWASRKSTGLQFKCSQNQTPTIPKKNRQPNSPKSNATTMKLASATLLLATCAVPFLVVQGRMHHHDNYQVAAAKKAAAVLPPGHNNHNRGRPTTTPRR